MQIPEIVKDVAYSDYRLRTPIGILCKIVECFQYNAFGAILRVIPIDERDGADVAISKVIPYNVHCVNPQGLMGFHSNVREMYNALVLTGNPSVIEGQPAFLIPKSFLYRSIADGLEKHSISQEVISKEGLETKKDLLIKGRKFD